MIKLQHSVFALPFAVAGAFLSARSAGSAAPSWGALALIVLAMVSARSAAMAFNRIVDRDFDAANPRTAGRHLPAGRLSVRAAWAFLAGSVALFAGACAAFLPLYDNPWPARLGAGVLAVLLGYSLSKRFTSLCHFWLGVSLGLAPVAAGIAVAGTTDSPGVPPEVWLLAAGVALWTAGFDVIYACQDAEFDRATGLRSVPASLGVAGALWVARACHVAAWLLLAMAVGGAGLGGIARAGLGVAMALLLWEHSLLGDLRLRRPDLSRVDAAFFTANGAVSLAVGACIVADVLVG